MNQAENNEKNIKTGGDLSAHEGLEHSLYLEQEDTQGDRKDKKNPAAALLERFPEFEGIFGREWDGLLEHSSSDFLMMPNSTKFHSTWSAYTHGREELLNVRKLWVAMKEKGGEFTSALEHTAFSLLEVTHFTGRLYHLINTYESLGSPNATAFYAKLLSDKRVWNQHDGSVTSILLRHFENFQDILSRTVLLDHLDHILSPEYTRAEFRGGDLEHIVYALQKVCGDEVVSILDKYAEESDSFVEWWEKKKTSLLVTPNFSSALKKPIVTPIAPFDLVKERAYLQELEQDLSDHPHKEKNFTFNPHSDLDPDLGLDLDDFEDTYDVSRDFPEHKPQNLKDEGRSPYKKRTINFYGRFRPNVEHPVSLNETNALSAICYLVKMGKGGHEEYLRYLSGVVEEGELFEQLPDTVTSVELGAIVRAACARITYLGTIEGNMQQAGAEREELRSFLEKVNVPKDAVSHYLGKLVDLDMVLKKVPHEKELSPLPNSASPFFVYHQKRKKMREIPAFTELLAEKIRYLTSLSLAGEAPWGVERMWSEYKNQHELYRTIQKEDVPVYWEATDRLSEADTNRFVVFGRDGKYLFTALKAGDFGQDERELKYVLLTRNIRNHETRETIAKYLKQQGVQLDSYFIDTGYSGSIPELAIQLLAEAGGVEISDTDIDKRVKLLSSIKFRRQGLAAQEDRRQSDVVSRIESRPLPVESPSYYQITPEGKLLPEEQPTPANTQLSAWVIEHAVMRNFVPRFDPEQRVRTPSSLEGYRFLERFSGDAVVSTHPLELWEEPNGKKILLKGGPKHTLRADYVGSRFFEHMSVPCPRSELLNTEDGLKLKMEYLDGWEDGPLSLPERFHDSKQIQAGFFVDLLLQQYDRTSWNMMFKGDHVAFIDHGAGLHSRARGGYKGFPMVVTAENIAEILEHPMRPGKVVNEAYGALVEFKDHKTIDQNTGKTVVMKKLVIKNKERVLSLLRRFNELCFNDSHINKFIDEAGFFDGRRAVEGLERTLEELKHELLNLSPDSREAQKHQGAIETIEAMIAAGGEASYLKQALKQRFKGIINLFESAL